MADWRERLKSDPRGTVAELLERFAARRGADPEVEDLCWRALADHATPEELARAVLGRLRVGEEALTLSEEAPRLPPLLDLDREHRIRVRGRLRLAAADALAGFVRDPEERARIEAHPARLPEAAFERRGRPREAAALYALEHDQLPKDAAEPLLGAALRYPLARALFRVGGRVEGGIGHERERAAAVMTSVLALLEAPPAGAPEAERSLAGRLTFHTREWLGLRHYEAGRYREAVGEFLRAAEAAPDTDLELAARIFAANALIRAGHQDEARQLLDAVRERSPGMSPDVSEEWDTVWRRLLEARGEEDEES